MKNQIKNQISMFSTPVEKTTSDPFEDWVAKMDKGTEETFKFYEYIADKFKQKFGLTFDHTIVSLYSPVQKRWLRDQKTLFTNKK